MVRILLVSLFVLVFVTVGHADEKAGLADQLLLKTGSYELIASYPQQIRAYAAQQSPYATDRATSSEAVKVLLAAFNQAEANAVLLNHLVTNFSTQELSSMVAWLDSPLGARLIAAEVEAASVEGQNNLLRYAATLSSNPPSESRIDLIQELERKAGWTELALEVMSTIMTGIAQAANAALPESERRAAGEIEAALAEVLGDLAPMLRQQLWQQMLLSAHYTYRDFTAAEIRAYINFLESDTGRQYSEVAKGIGEVFAGIFAKAVKQLETLPPDRAG